MFAKLLIGTLLNEKRSCPQNIVVWAMCKCMVSMATHSPFENGVMPTKVFISQLCNVIVDSNIQVRVVFSKSLWNFQALYISATTLTIS